MLYIHLEFTYYVKVVMIMKVNIKIQKDGYIVLGNPITPKQACILDAIIFDSLRDYFVGTVLTVDLTTRKVEKSGRR